MSKKLSSSLFAVIVCALASVAQVGLPRIVINAL